MRLMLLFLVFGVLSCKAQTLPSQNIILVEDHFNYPNDIPDGTYIKDVNNVLDKYSGTWTGNYNSRNYVIVIEKTTVSYLKISNDVLLLRYKITDSNGTILYNTLTLPNDNDYVAEGEYVNPSGSYQLDYAGFEYDCGQSGTLFIKTFNNNTQMKLYLHLGESPYNEDDCPNGFAEQVFPTNSQMILTKQ